MLNRTQIIGRLTADPELRYTQGGVAVATLRVAVDRNYKNGQGDKLTDFFDVSVWRKLAETCANYLTKGRLVYIEGPIYRESWEKDGQKHYSWKIHAENVQFLDRVNSGNGASAGGFSAGQQYYEDDRPTLTEEDVPF